jgi:hypothetical protein
LDRQNSQNTDLYAAYQNQINYYSGLNSGTPSQPAQNNISDNTPPTPTTYQGNPYQGNQNPGRGN